MNKFKNIFINLLILIFILYFFKKSPIFAVTPPISGTFIMADMPTSPEILNQVYNEMKETGIDTVIFLAAGGWWPLPCSTSPPNFTEQYYFTPNSWYLNSLKQSKNLGMKIFFGLVNTDLYNCTPFWREPYRSKILNYANKLIDQLKQTVSSQGWSWDDPQFVGFYVPEQGIGAFTNNTNSDTQFWKDLVSIIKNKAPNKKVLMSPWVLESYDYNLAKKAYLNLYNTIGIDIIAPQDSMGTLKVTSYAKSSELFRALHDVAQQTGKTAWANIETFTQDSPSSSSYYPSNINKISQQIAAASPYVSKMITWIYQYTMLSNPTFDNFSSWTGAYTPVNAQRRKQLRNDYMAYYNFAAVCQLKYYYHLNKKQCQQTTALYHNTTLKQCGVADAPTCSENLTRYLPGQTTGVCYRSLNDCQQVKITPNNSNNLCICSTTNICDDTYCKFDKFPIPTGTNPAFTYSSPIKCGFANFQSTPTADQKNAWCRRYYRTKGDANGDGKATLIDYFYYVAARSGAKIPPNIMPDFNGDNFISDMDRNIIIKSLKQ